MKSGSITTIVSASCTKLICAFILLKTMDYCPMVRERKNAVLRAIAAGMVG
jgi:hypothetical protein